MGKKGRLLAILALSFFAQACNSVDTAQQQQNPLTPKEVNKLVKFVPPSTIKVSEDTLNSARDYGIESIESQCARQTWLPWCPNGTKQTITKALPIAQISEISHSVQNGYEYRADGEDSWNSYAALHIKHELWYGDCDDLTSTTLEMLHRSGQPLDKMWMLLNNVHSKGTLDHIVGIVQAADGKFYVVGDTDKKNVYPLEQMPMSPRSIVRMDEATNWGSPVTSPVFKNYPVQLGKKPKVVAPAKRKARR